MLRSPGTTERQRRASGVPLQELVMFSNCLVMFMVIKVSVRLDCAGLPPAFHLRTHLETFAVNSRDGGLPGVPTVICVYCIACQL